MVIRRWAKKHLLEEHQIQFNTKREWTWAKKMGEATHQTKKDQRWQQIIKGQQHEVRRGHAPGWANGRIRVKSYPVWTCARCQLWGAESVEGAKQRLNENICQETLRKKQAKTKMLTKWQGNWTKWEKTATAREAEKISRTLEEWRAHLQQNANGKSENELIFMYTHPRWQI